MNKNWPNTDDTKWLIHIACQNDMINDISYHVDILINFGYFSLINIFDTKTIFR